MEYVNLFVFIRPDFALFYAFDIYFNKMKPTSQRYGLSCGCSSANLIYTRFKALFEI